MEGSELRRDIVSGDWIIIAPGRSKRPSDLIKHNKTPRISSDKSTCPFENPEESSGNKSLLTFKNDGDWFIKIIENKYPAVVHANSRESVVPKQVGPYQVVSGYGHHDLLIARYHDKNLPDLTNQEATLLFEAMRDRYLMLFNDTDIQYVSMFQNWGPSAGASIYHPHFQMLGMPVLPADIFRSLTGSAKYRYETGNCVHCTIKNWEASEGVRVIAQNDYALGVCPYFSRTAFEMRIFPKKHLSYFENTLDEDLSGVVDVLQRCLALLKKNVGDPDYNFFIHTPPTKDKDQYDHYHWHIEILPKITHWGGFELSSGVEINPVDPDEAAKLLRG